MIPRRRNNLLKTKLPLPTWPGGGLDLTDDGIKEVYWLAVLVHSQGQQHLPIQIFPARLTEDGFQSLVATHPNQSELVTFWRNLKKGYDLFEKNHRLPRIKINPRGAYESSPPDATP